MTAPLRRPYSARPPCLAQESSTSPYRLLQVGGRPPPPRRAVPVPGLQPLFLSDACPRPPRLQLRLARIPHLVDRFNLAECFCAGCAKARHSDCEVAYFGSGRASCDQDVLRRMRVHAGRGERRCRRGDGMRRTVAGRRGGER